MDWRKSTFSSAQGGACVEVASKWRKSSFSGGSTNDCVEVAAADGVLVRDTTNRRGVTLDVPGSAWSEFLAALR